MIRGVDGLAAALEVRPEDLRQLVATAEERYRVWPLATRPGKRRFIQAPDAALKLVQERLLRSILYALPPREPAHGFVPGRSIVTNAAAHVGRAWVWTADIRDFFPSTKAGAVVAAIADLEGVDAPAREAILALVTFSGALPQGAPTSPHLANLVFRPLDDSLAAVAAARGMTYTRYADDLTFSGEERPAALAEAVAAAIAPAGYRLAPDKTRLMGRHRRQEVTGLVVNEKVQTPRRHRRWLRAVLHDARERGVEAAAARSGLGIAALLGHLAFFAMASPEAAAKLGGE